jgi:hypothetical protein
MLGNFSVAERLAASQSGLSSMEFVILLYVTDMHHETLSYPHRQNETYGKCQQPGPIWTYSLQRTVASVRNGSVSSFHYVSGYKYI